MTRRRRATAGLLSVTLAAAILTVALAGGGQSSHRPASATAAFAWLHPAPPPTGWHVARSRGGALPYPPGWKHIKTDPGTASVALLGAGRRIDGFLNATPNQGPETLANWSRFRPAHNRSEGDLSVRLLAASNHLTFRSGRGACVIDDYRTTKASYREIACLVSGPREPAVIVAAAPTALWSRQAPTLQRAVSSFEP